MGNYNALRANVGMLGTKLGETIRHHLGESLLDRVEQIRLLSKEARQGNNEQLTQLKEVLTSLKDDELLPVARAFAHFLNLTNLAEQHHTISKVGSENIEKPHPLTELFSLLKNQNISPSAINSAISNFNIELVLTAHPTEVSRRTIIAKLTEIANCLHQLEFDLPITEQVRVEQRLSDLIAQAWHSNEIRESRPTPVDEAKSGFAVIESSLWHAIPDFLREFNNTVIDATGQALPIDAAPIKFSSWMGGDRDGNPFVTAKVTREVLLLSRWKAADLFINDLNVLSAELSMNKASEALKQATDNASEPYRAILKKLKADLINTRTWITENLAQDHEERPSNIIWQNAQLIEPLQLCYQSLHEQGMSIIADNLLTDTLRRAYTFGLTLLQLDIRQDAERHTQVLSEITQYLALGDYQQWPEEQRQQFLLQELAGKRPLFPIVWQPSADVKEVLDTFSVIAKYGEDALSTYVIQWRVNLQMF